MKFAGTLRRTLQASWLRRLAVHFQHRGLQPEDVFLASYPKSGNTWMKFMLAQIAAGSEVDFDRVEDFVPEVGSHKGGPAKMCGLPGLPGVQEP